MNVYQIVGYIVCIALALAILLVAIGYATNSWTKLVEEHGRYAYSESRRRLGQQLIGESYWFSEHKDAEIVLRTLGKYLLREDNYNISHLRDEFKLESK